MYSNAKRAPCTFRLVACVLLLLPTMCLGAKILMMPFTQVFNSRTMNLEKIARLLIDRGHNVTMIVADHYQPRSNISEATLIRFQTPKLKVNKGGKLSLETIMTAVDKDPAILLRDFSPMESYSCDYMFGNNALLQDLKASNFSLFFFDCINLLAGPLLNYFLEVPSIAYSNYGFWDVWWVFQQPVFKSFMPSIPGGHSDHMTFWERVDNYDVDRSVREWLDERIEDGDNLISKYFPNQNWPPMSRAFQRVSLMIAANADFAFDYPRPVMPHVKPISGLLLTPPKPLPKFYEDIMASATPGVVLMSFGTLVADLAEETSEMIARVLARLPHTVIWRYEGASPKSLGGNTHLVNWFPQNDALAHPATKLFITHCGVSSSWETMYHAVPIVAVPLIWDQHQNARKLTDRLKMGKSLKFSTLSEADFEKAIHTVLNDKSYKDNAVKVSELIQDQPMAAKEELLFWINFVMRHNGTLNFHSEAAYSLNWYQYYLLDVIAYKIGVRCLYYILYLSPFIMIWKLLQALFYSQSKKEKSV